jgi:hypothetical protein
LIEYIKMKYPSIKLLKTVIIVYDIHKEDCMFELQTIIVR